MTLFRQLLGFAFIILLCLCIGLWVAELKRTRAYLVSQLTSHAQDTATSLGLSLTALTDGVDVPVMETMVSALFDRGYYQRIRVVDIEGQILVDRSINVNLDQVPTWFTTMVELEPPRGEALVMAGWRQIGSVTVESHPGYAYRMLWQSARDTGRWFLFTGLIITLVGGLGLRGLLGPLRRVEAQALALCERNFQIQDQLPRTRELRQVVLAMNRMTSRIREMFEEQAAVAESLRQRAYQDPVTGVGNRRYIEAQVKAKIEEKTGTIQGAFLLLRIQGLQEINRTGGYEAGDRLLRESAAIMSQVCRELPEAVIARLGGGDFALLLPNLGTDLAHQIAAATLDALRHPTTDLPDPVIIACGGVVYERATSCRHLLEQADTALASAGYGNTTPAVLLGAVSDEHTITMGQSQWRDLLDCILEHRSVILYGQPTVSLRDPERTSIHLEILTRVSAPDNRLLSVGQFVPTAERLGLMPALDKMIIEQILAEPLLRRTSLPTAINLSPLSLTDQTFVIWLHDQLERCAREGLRLNFEFPEFRLLRHSDLIAAFARRIRPRGHCIGIDHFGQGLIHFGYLQSLLPDYVKIDRALTNTLQDDHGDSSFFINALCTAAHSLDIKVMVEGIETEAQWRTLATMPLDGAQGFFIQHPRPLDELVR
ncbi:EAL domain-containing protein [Desulfobulbus alkaliphilus]|uniref:EAL domain-containing protein n=1 Tax=Desulfobulbus alkaliphilus TaxID=869814 RepID=UPI001965F4D0|nr:EAL domain-containing protein [Desulfobulbus alkaliphilus]MBM9538131.1 EAL domain-containing protein [Desulfobulbus alkaliphilus]